MRRALLLALLLASCRKDSTPLTPPTFAIGTPANVSSEQIACRRKRADEVFLTLSDAGLALHVEMTPGSSVSVLGRAIALPGDVVIADGLAQLAEGRANEPWMTVDVKVTDVSTGRSAVDRVELRVDRVFAKRLEAARTGGLRFDGETARAATAEQIAYVRRESRPAFVVGPRARWRDIDLVAFETMKSEGAKDCGFVESEQPFGTVDGKIPRLALGTTSNVELWDRRAGTLVAKTSFHTDAMCRGDEADAAPTVSNEQRLREWLGAKTGH